MEWISHNDRTLREHLAGLKAVVDALLPEKYQTFWAEEDLRNLLYLLIAYHDLAKSSIYFQVYLSNALIRQGDGHLYHSKEALQFFVNDNREAFDQLKRHPERQRHALFGGWAYLAHIDNQPPALFDFLMLKILKRHHGYLRDFEVASMNPNSDYAHLAAIDESMAYEDYAQMISEVGLVFTSPDIKRITGSFKVRAFNKLTAALESDQDASPYFQTLYLFSLLLSADKGDVMLDEKSFQRVDIPDGIIDTFKKGVLQAGFSINTLREKAYQTAVDHVTAYGPQSFYSITLPTGLGKTLTAYKTALMIKALYRPDFRVVYCLPFTSIIDQNALIFQRILEFSDISSEHMGIHHHLSMPDISKTEDDSFYSEWEYFTEGWQHEMTITTFVQLWESLFANHNRQIRKFHNLANSIIILDEIQAMPPALYPALEFVMEKMAEFFNTTFILVTATQPILLPNRIKELCWYQTDDYFFRQLNRTFLDQSFLSRGVLDSEDFAALLIDQYEGKTTLAICNTVRYSQQVYDRLMEVFDDDMVYYLSASIIPYSRKEVLEVIKERLRLKRPTVLVSTQVVEAGVDVDFEVVYRDFCPLSSINQAAGRCNRNGEGVQAKVVLFNSGKQKIYDPVLLDSTAYALEKFGEQIREEDFYDLNQIYFEQVKSRKQDHSSIGQQLIQSIYQLKFLDIGTNPNYRLIQKKYQSYNLFIPVHEEAEALWEEYLQLLKIEEHFKRKRALKSLMPMMMFYTASIPDYIYQPDANQKDSPLLYEADWSFYYDLQKGYKLSVNEHRTEIL